MNMGYYSKPSRDMSMACPGLFLLAIFDHRSPAVLPQPRDSNIGDRRPREAHLAEPSSVYIAS